MDVSLGSHLGQPRSPRHHRVTIPSAGSPDSSLPTRSGISRGSSTGSALSVTPAQAAATNSLQLLLREDRLLHEYGLTESKSNPDQVAFPYAAALLREADGENEVEKSHIDSKNRADFALQDVERKLALVESLAVKLSRTRPEAVAGHLLRLHGYESDLSLVDENNENLTQNSFVSTSTTPLQSTCSTLSSIRDRADRLERQADVLDGVARRVEVSLSRGLSRMEVASTRLERVLTLSSTLKSILRLQFECNKLCTYDLEDARDLTRAAASVAILEDLLSKPELQHDISVMETMRPDIKRTATKVREVAAFMLQEQYSRPTSLAQLGAILQVYFHLGELPHAVWEAVDRAHDKAEEVSRRLFDASYIGSLTEQARKGTKEARLFQKRLKQLREDAAQEWIQALTDVTLQVRNLQRVLNRKSDPYTRQVFGDVVAAAPTPSLYTNFREASIFSLFWARMCQSLSNIIRDVLNQDQGKYVGDVAAFYPVIRSATIELIGRLQEILPASAFDETIAAPNAGILGGSLLLNDAFLGWSTTGRLDQGPSSAVDNPQSPADAWTRGAESLTQYGTRGMMSAATISITSVFQSHEWKTLQSNGDSKSGLFPLQQAFVAACNERLNTPLQYMFPEHVHLDDNGIPLPTGLPLLPSKYDIQRFDENIRQELSLADPREGGGDVTLVNMIAECVVGMISNFCDRAKNAVSGVSEDGYIKNDWTMTEALQHDRKVIAMMFALSKCLRESPEKTFVAPYRPAFSTQHEEAARVCQAALMPAIQNIEKMVRLAVLDPLCRAVNRRIFVIIVKMHQGAFGENISHGTNEDPMSFVQKYLSPILESVAENLLSRFPPEYAAFMAAKIATFSVFAYISNASLLRPMKESTRLHITQDLADLELALEQLLIKNGGSQTLIRVDSGKAYTELRATRQMLFWTGLESENKSASDVTKALLREPWVKDMRPSTIFHYLFSFAPSLLSLPHHVIRLNVEDYVSRLVMLNNSGGEGEEFAWMTILASCESYQQRASSVSSENLDGDPRIAHVILQLGQELTRRRQNF